MSAATKIFEEDRDRALGQVKRWERLCGAFSFRFEYSERARQLLIDALAYISACRETTSLKHRLRYGQAAVDFVDAWVKECRRRHCRIELSERAEMLLRGELINPMTLTGVAPGQMAQLVRRMGCFLEYKVPQVDPSLN